MFRNVSNSQTRNTLLHKDKGKRKRINPESELPLPKKARTQKGEVKEDQNFSNSTGCPTVDLKELASFVGIKESDFDLRSAAGLLDYSGNLDCSILFKARLKGYAWNSIKFLKIWV